MKMTHCPGCQSRKKCPGIEQPPESLEQTFPPPCTCGHPKHDGFCTAQHLSGGIVGIVQWCPCTVYVPKET